MVSASDARTANVRGFIHNSPDTTVMRQIITRFIRLSAGYSLVTLAGPLLTVLLTPLYTRVLAPSDYASIEVMSTLTALMVGIATLGMDHVLNSRYFDPTIESRTSLLRTAFTIVIAISVILSLSLVTLSSQIAATFLQNPNLIMLPIIVSVSVIAGPLYVLLGSVLRLQMNIRRVNLFGWCAVLVTALGNVLLVVILRIGVAGALIANAAAYVACALLGMVMLRKDIRGPFNIQLARRLTIAGIALLPGTLSWLMLMNIDRLLLTQYVSLEQLGLYSIANKLASILGFVFTTMWAAWLPMAISMLEKGQDTRPISKMFEIFGGISIILALALGLFAPEILAIATRPVYVPAAPYAAALMIYVGPIMFMGSFFTIEHYVAKSTHILGICILIGAISNIALNFLLNPILGIWGAVAATLIAGFIVFFLSALLRRNNGTLLMFPIKKMLMLSLLLIIVVGAALYSGALTLVVKTILVVMVSGIVVLAVLSHELLGKCFERIKMIAPR